jgi:hypothetical protein
MTTKRDNAGDGAWRDRPLLTVQDAATVAGLSTASIYRFAGEGRINLVRLGGRTLVTVESLTALIATAEPWSPSARGSAARAARSERAQAARREFAA